MPEIVTVKKRVTRLEDLMAQLIRTVDQVDRQLDRTDEQIERTQRNLDLLSAEMRDSHDRWEQEMREFKAEMHASRERSEQEMREFKTEMHASRERSEQEMREFKIESRKQWGELSNKLGTMAEDLVAPSIERILRETVGCAKEDVECVAVRVKRRHPVAKTRQEFDVVAVCGEYMLINETKSTLSPEVMKEFVERQLPQVREFFPEYSQKKIIGAIASLYVDESLVRYGERLGLIVLGFGEDLMDILNTPGFTPMVF